MLRRPSSGPDEMIEAEELVELLQCLAEVQVELWGCAERGCFSVHASPLPPHAHRRR